MKEGLIKAWQINNDNNLLLLKHLDENFLLSRIKTRGRTVGDQVVHMHNTRIAWTEFVAKEIFDKTLLIKKESNPDTTHLASAFAASAKKIEEVIHRSWEKEGKLPSFKYGLIPFVSYLVSHESHHRGNILLTLKQHNFKLPHDLQWGLWEWGK